MAQTGRTSVGSGRRKGSFSFVNITLADLNAKFADQSTPIRVGRVWAETVGFKELIAKAANDLGADAQGLEPSSKVAARSTELD